MWSRQMVLEPCSQLFPITEPVVRLLNSDPLISIIPVVGKGKFGVVYRHFYIPRIGIREREIDPSGRGATPVCANGAL